MKGIATASSPFNKVHIDLSCIGTTFHDSIHHCSFHFILLLLPFHLTPGFSGQRRARVTSTSLPLLSLSSLFSLSCLDSLTKDCQGFQLRLPASSPSFTSFAHYVATQRADVTLFLPALKKKLRATSSGLPSRPCVRSTRLLAVCIRVCGCTGWGSGLQSPSC